MGPWGLTGSTECKMTKTRRLQVRVAEDQRDFLLEYSLRHGVSISLMIRDFIEWLKKREGQGGYSAP